jgi:carbonic anhydrase/acetyltransferase-like protein (isoleucine patch superfamily)
VAGSGPDSASLAAGEPTVVERPEASRVVEPAAIVCDWSRVGEESVRAGACVKQRDTHPARSVLDGFRARQVDTLLQAPGRPTWALSLDAVDVIHRIDR